jgi:high-affinity nickel permease
MGELFNICISNCFTTIIKKKNNVILIKILISSRKVKISEYQNKEVNINNVLLERFAV